MLVRRSLREQFTAFSVLALNVPNYSEPVIRALMPETADSASNPGVFAPYEAENDGSTATSRPSCHAEWFAVGEVPHSV